MSQPLSPEFQIRPSCSLRTGDKRCSTPTPRTLISSPSYSIPIIYRNIRTMEFIHTRRTTRTAPSCHKLWLRRMRDFSRIMRNIWLRQVTTTSICILSQGSTRRGTSMLTNTGSRNKRRSANSTQRLIERTSNKLLRLDPLMKLEELINSSRD